MFSPSTPRAEPIDVQSEPRRSGILGAGALYTVVGLVQRIGSLVLLPFFAHWLSAADYGKIGFLAALFSFATYVFPFGLETVVMREWFLRAPRADRLRYGSEIQTLLLIGPVLLVIPCAAVLVFLGAAPSIGFVLVAECLGAAAVFVAATVVPYTVLRAERRARAYLLLGLLYTVVQIGTRVLLVAVAGKGVAGWVAADLISSAVLLAVAPRTAGLTLRLRRMSAQARASLRKGLHLLPHGLGHWALALSDRLILVHAVSFAALGSYTVGYQVAAVLIACFSEFNRAVSPEYAALGSSRAAQSEGIRRLVSAQAGTVIAVGLAAAIVAPPAIRLVLPASYGGAASIVPWVALGAVFNGLYQIPMNHLTLVCGETRRIWIATVTATLVNIVLNLATVWRFGIIAAAINTTIAYGVLLVLVRWYEGHVAGARLRPDRALAGSYAKALGSTLIAAALAFAFLSGLLEFAVAMAVASVGVVWALALYRRAEQQWSGSPEVVGELDSPCNVEGSYQPTRVRRAS